MKFKILLMLGPLVTVMGLILTFLISAGVVLRDASVVFASFAIGESLLVAGLIMMIVGLVEYQGGWRTGTGVILLCLGYIASAVLKDAMSSSLPADQALIIPFSAFGVLATLAGIFFLVFGHKNHKKRRSTGIMSEAKSYANLSVGLWFLSSIYLAWPKLIIGLFSQKPLLNNNAQQWVAALVAAAFLGSLTGLIMGIIGSFKQGQRKLAVIGVLLCSSLLVLSCYEMFSELSNKQKGSWSSNSALSETMVFNGGSLRPPRAKKWVLNTALPDNVISFVIPTKGTHTFMLQVKTTPFEDTPETPEGFLEFVKNRFQTTNEAYKKGQTNFYLDSTFGKYCVRYEVNYEDHGFSKIVKEEVGYLNMTIHGYAFLHPNIENLLITVDGSERCLPSEEKDPLFQKDMEAFFKSITLANPVLDEAESAFNSKNYSRAAELYRIEADRGDAKSQYYIGLMHSGGLGMQQDHMKAIKWYRLAANQGYMSAQYSLGLNYYLGEGVSQDDGEAAKLFRLASDQWHASAQLMLGSMYEKGRGVQQNYQDAMKWYRFAAGQGGIALAQNKLGVMYYQGQGEPKNLVKAYAWWTIADTNGDRDAPRNMKLATKEMKPAQVDKAKKFVEEYFAIKRRQLVESRNP